MRWKLFAFVLLWAGICLSVAQTAKPLRVFIRAGVKTHGPGQHDHPRFLAEYSQLLRQRGMSVAGAMDFPTGAQLENSDVVVFYAAEGATIHPAERADLDKFLQRGGGLVVIHDAVCGTDPHWFKTIVGGAWEHRHSKWLEGEVGIYFLDPEHPITRGISNFEFKDEIYYDLHLMPEAEILAASFHSVFNIAPQMWVYEKANYRAFVCLQGHEYTSFGLPHFRAILLRGIAWAGKQEADKYLTRLELASLKYPEGGPTAPEKAAATIEAHPEFGISLVASEPLIEKPISMDWDREGRLWVAETPEYPNGRRIDKNDEMIALWRSQDSKSYQGPVENRLARDRISILTDSDGDGRMDRKTIFYEGLELITSLVLYRDGAIVAQPPDIYWLRDTDHDGKADKKEVLLTGFGTFDTHAVLSNMRWGMDGWIYATQGYSGAEPSSPGGARRFGKLGSGVLRFRPDGSAVEMVSSKSGNTWGLDFAWDNELFFTQANGAHLQHIVMPESVLARGRVGSTPSFHTIADHTHVVPLLEHKKQPYVQIDNVGGFTAASGSAIYSGGAWPEPHHYTHFVSEPTVNIVHQDILRPQGATFTAFKARDEEFIAGRDLWFRPIHQRVGPDGGLYLLDFYNQAAVHNDTRGPRHGAGNAAVRPDRDHHFGRIWRIQHKKAKALEQPKLRPDQTSALVKALEHPNGFFRMTAHRLLVERGKSDVVGSLRGLLASNKPAFARLHALWILENLSHLPEPLLLVAINDSQPALRKNALRIISERDRPPNSPELARSVLNRLRDTDPRTQLQGIIALGSLPVTKEISQSLVEIYPELKDRWMESAVVGVASRAPLEFIRAAFSSTQSEPLDGLVAELSRQIGVKDDPHLAAQLVTLIGSAPGSADRLKQVALQQFTAAYRTGAAPAWSDSLQRAFQGLARSTNELVASAALPLIARWDNQGTLKSELAPLITRLIARLEDPNEPEEKRAQALSSLVAVHPLNTEILPAITKLLASAASSPLKGRAIEAMGNLADPIIARQLLAMLPQLSGETQENALNQLLKRIEWTKSLVESIQAGEIKLGTLSPATIHRLRHHSDPSIAQQANRVIDEIRGPEIKEKNLLVAQFSPAVGQPGDVEQGKKLFAQNCATCHRFHGEGKELAPDLTGMGAHGPAELLIHVLDPNRVVEPNYITQSIETADGEVYDGIVAQENQTSVVLRNAQGDTQLKRNQIKSRRSTGLSLMPNGFEALGPEALRDLMTYLTAGEGQFRLLDLTGAFTANSAKGIYHSENSPDETLRFKKFGIIKAGEVPFEIVSPARSSTGKNVIVLKGGSGFAKTLPQRVEVKVGLSAAKLHFLGGVGGWAYPFGDPSGHHLPVLKATVQHANNELEEILLHNGTEFADYIGAYNVPGSKPLPELVKSGQVRWFSKPVKSDSPIQKITLESYNNHVAPTIVAITAELLELPQKQLTPVGAGDSSAIPATRVLIVGGGSSHDYERWFHQADSATLQASGKVEARYLDDPAQILPLLKEQDVLYLSNNQPLPQPELRNAIFDFVDSGKGLLLVHAALWHNWADWPEYNRILAGGGSRSHGPYGEFEVTATDSTHPLMQGVPASFQISDELYRFDPDPNGSPIEILAAGKEPKTGKIFPVVFVVKHPKARIACITLGHDGRAHQHPAFQKILQNGVRWVARGSSTPSSGARP